ncbi:MAG: hypothetical protein KAR40_06290 [Candidatus Sabulitectum sp.]|nr:hypothetical protein [Candidatus Sabulitectum sp.]
MKLNRKHITEYFKTARERYQIHMNKDALYKDAPYTKDPIFQEWRFCNVHREHDKVSNWIEMNVRQLDVDYHRMVFNLSLCRLINRIETLEIIKEAGLFEKWDTRKARRKLTGLKPLVGAAYVIKTPTGKNKLEGVLYIVKKIKARLRVTNQSCPTTLQQQWEILMKCQFIGSFMAYEITSDMRHTIFLDDARDINTWAVPGPGACAGLSWLVDGTLTSVPYRASTREVSIAAMQQLLECSKNEKYWPQEWPAWEMREAEHWLCEYAKYAKVKHLGMRMKRRYKC